LGCFWYGGTGNGAAVSFKISFMSLVDKFRRFYAGLNMFLKIPVFLLMALPFIGIFLGVTFGLTKGLGWEDNFGTWLLAVIPSFGGLLALLIFLFGGSVKR
jgi:hypothetical protein